MASDEHAHLVLVTALRVVDDTALLSKAVVQELKVRRAFVLQCWVGCPMAADELAVSPWRTAAPSGVASTCRPRPVHVALLPLSPHLSPS